MTSSRDNGSCNDTPNLPTLLETAWDPDMPGDGRGEGRLERRVYGPTVDGTRMDMVLRP